MYNPKCINAYVAVYLLVISPSSSVKNVVLRLRAKLGNKIGIYPARYSQPHITILSVVIDDSLEHKLFNSLRKIIAQESPISMTAHGIECFPSNKTIYVGIRETNLFSTLSKNIWRSPFVSGLPKEFKTSSYVPHLTIGRSLNYNFDSAQNCFKEYSYEESFMADSALY
ncbi:hypothetical protein AAE02nite_46920 [Adhaeribacter aerolatus]|uniref:2'-5' RNA ligase n=1 Tax=Adhaeribacter aerolatus TaxID=670289 RepID=A0A512B4Y7_9BACT|nr:2'-5' RNA ligase family protein [Adhaeribacter aerolatus]GEO07028.1 hypothetical protein AAE02nite_46920 [Adhaeribacter aerolatus]